MIITETVTIDGRKFIKNYSDENRYVVRDGIAYSEAIDPIGTNRVYSEGAHIPTEEYSELKAQAYDVLTGVSE